MDLDPETLEAFIVTATPDQLAAYCRLVDQRDRAKRAIDEQYDVDISRLIHAPVASASSW